MPKTIQELAAAAAITDTSTTQISEVQGTEWMSRVIQFGEALRRFDQVAIMDQSLVGKGDKTLTVPKSTSVLAIDSAPSGGEGDVRDITEITNLDTVSMTIAASDFKRGVVAITKQILLTSRVDLVRQARYAIANALANDLDNDVVGSAGFQSTAITQRIYGGDATGPATLATGDVITPDLVADAMSQIEDDNFVPAVLFVAPAQIKAFRKDSQFVNAAEYGSNVVVMKGEIGNWLGVRIIATTNAPAFASGATDTNETPATWGAAGHVCPLVGTDKAGANNTAIVAWKELPHIDFEYRPDEALHKIFYDQAYKVGLIQEKAVSLIKVTDA